MATFKRLIAATVVLVLLLGTMALAQVPPFQLFDPATNATAVLAIDATLDTTSQSTGPQGFCHGVSTMPTAVTTGRSARILCTTLGILFTTPVAASLGGATPVRYISVGTSEDKHSVCASLPCNLYSIAATNSNASIRYLKCENDTSANTAPGTDTPEFSMALPANGVPVTAAFPVGKFFSVALTCWTVTGAADSDVTEVAANDILLNYDVK